MYKLTEKGKKKVQHFIRECVALQKEVVDAGKDTANETYLPTEVSILEDIEYWEDDDGIYNNSWAVTDNYYDLPLELIKNIDFIEA